MTLVSWRYSLERHATNHKMFVGSALIRVFQHESAGAGAAGDPGYP